MNPYQGRPDFAFWRTEVGNLDCAPAPHVEYSPFINRATRVGTAGSCFAQHIARRLGAGGYTYHIEETAPPFMSAEIARSFGFGLYSARYGNIYTPRQMLQLVQRAQGTFVPSIEAWKKRDRFVDPFRPTVQPSGFGSQGAIEDEQRCHFKAILRLFQKIDVFVFTLGLTEAWVHTGSGAVVPVCPGTSAGGEFDDTQYEFHNFTLQEVVADMRQFIEIVRIINPALKFILTVSPVPLVATMEAHSVLTSTIYSKSLLRVAAEEIVRDTIGVYYFPSYEIVSGNFRGLPLFESDQRNVAESTVDHVMDVFFNKVCGESRKYKKVAQIKADVALQKRAVDSQLSGKTEPLTPNADKEYSDPSFVDLVCDENLLAEHMTHRDQQV